MPIFNTQLQEELEKLFGKKKKKKMKPREITKSRMKLDLTSQMGEKPQAVVTGSEYRG